MSKCAIIIFAKAPVPGQVKTRLQSHLSPEECAELHSSFIIRAISIAGSAGDGKILLACSPDAAHPFFQEISRSYGISLLTQKGADLGERMENAIGDAISEGYEKVIIIGSDSPDLPPDFIKEGFRRLDESEMVIGPSEDGGYYLIGARRPVPVFDRIQWGSDTVFDATLERALMRGIIFHVLPGWYDVDTWEDLQKFRNKERLPAKKLP